MAGIIDFDTSHYWGSSGGVFRAITSSIIELLPNTDSAIRVRGFLNDAIDSNLMYVNFADDFDPGMKADFAEALWRHCNDPKTLDPSLFAEPEFHPGYLARLFQLLCMVEGDLEIASAVTAMKLMDLPALENVANRGMAAKLADDLQWIEAKRLRDGLTESEEIHANVIRRNWAWAMTIENHATALLMRWKIGI